MKRAYAWLIIVLFAVCQGTDTLTLMKQYMDMVWALPIAILSAFGFIYVLGWAFDNRKDYGTS